MKLTRLQLHALSAIPPDSKNDSKYIYKLLDFAFPVKEELSKYSLTGVPSRNPKHKMKSVACLDEVKIDFIKGKDFNFYISIKNIFFL
jgi:hypothetical protein